MAIPARVLCRRQEGKHQVALAEGEQRGHFKNHLRHFCITEAPSLLALLKTPRDGQRWGRGPDSGVRSGDVQSMEQSSPARGQWLQSRLAKLPARARQVQAPLSFAQTQIPHQRGCV